MMDYFIDRNFKYQQYRDKSVLIIGGGPSTLDVKWENLETDYVWSCNSFFMNEKILKQDLDLFALGNLQDWSHPNLIEYLDAHPNAKVLIENNYIYPSKLSSNTMFIKKYRDRIHYGELNKNATRIVGPPARMVILAANLGFKEINFVGIDGFDKDLKNTHAFTGETGLKSDAVHNTYDKYYNDHNFFAKSIQDKFGHRVNFRNLGELSASHNCMTDTSSKLFPLNEQINERCKPDSLRSSS